MKFMNLVMRLHGKEAPYEQLKQLTQGQKVDAESMQAFIESLDLPEEDKRTLQNLTPQSYTGNSATMASRDTLQAHIKSL